MKNAINRAPDVGAKKNKISKFINLQGKYLTSLLFVLFFAVGQMWAADVPVAYTYESSASKATMATNDFFSAASNPAVAGDGTFSANSSMLRCTVTKKKTATVTFTFTAKVAIEVASFTFNSYAGSDKIKSATVDYYKNSGTPTNVAVTFNKSSASDITITPTSAIEMAATDVLTIVVNLSNTDTGNDRPWNINTITLSASIPGQLAIEVDGGTTKAMVLGSETSIETSVDNASGSETYQWYKTVSTDTECASGTDISGAESDSYIPDEGSTGTYYYYCVVTDGLNTAKTELVTVNVFAPLTGWVVFDGLIDNAKRASPVTYNTVSMTYETSDVSVVDAGSKTLVGTTRAYSKLMQLSKSTNGYLKFTVPANYTATFTYAFAGTGNRTIMLASAKINSTSADGYIATLTSSVTSANIVYGEYTTPLAAGDYYICEGGSGNWQIAELVFTLAESSTPPTPVDPTFVYTAATYTIGDPALDLSTKLTSDSEGAITFAVSTSDAGTTGASIANGKNFTATDAGTATITVSQEAATGYNAKTQDITVTVQTAPEEKAGIKMVENGVWTGNFRIKSSQFKSLSGSNKYTIDGLDYTKYVELSSTSSSLGGETEGAQTKGIYYAPQKKNVKFWFYMRNTDTSAKTITVIKMEEGESSSSATVSVPVGSQLVSYDLTISKNTEVVFMVNSTKLLFCQIVAAESGDDLLQGGEVGYVFDYSKKRQNIAQETARTIDGIEYYLSAESKINSGTNVQLTTLGTHYIKFHLDARTKVSIECDNKPYKIGTSKSGETAQIYNGQDDGAFNLAAGDWYINGAGETVKITKLSFLTPDAAYAVTYNAGAGSVKSGKSLPTHDDAIKDEVITLASGENLEKSGYDFTGWKANGTGDLLHAGDEYTMGNAPVQFVAQWTVHVAKYGVKFMDGEEKLDSLSVTLGQAPSFADPTKPLYTFAGWKDGDNNEVTLSELATSVTVEDTKLVLYAQWSKVYVAQGTEYVFENNATVGEKSVTTTEKDYDAFMIGNMSFSATRIQYEAGTGGFGGWKIKKANATIKFFVENDSRVTVTVGTLSSGCNIAYTNTSEEAQNVALAAAQANAYDVKGGTLVTLTMQGASTVTLKGIAVSAIPAKSNDATLSDLTVGGTTVAGFVSSTLDYYVELPYGTSDAPTVAGTAHDTKALSVTPTQASTLPGNATVVVLAEDNSTTKTYTVHFTVAPKLGVELIKATHTSTTTASKAGYWTDEVTVDKSTQSKKLGANDNYFGLTLGTEKFKNGDIVVIYLDPTQTASAWLQLFKDKGSNIIADVQSGVTKGANYITLSGLPEAGIDKLYLYRTSAADGKMNPYVDYIAVYRYMAPFIEEFKIGDAVGTIDKTANPMTINVEVPYNVALTSLTPTIKAWANGGASVTPEGAQDFSNGAINYTVSGAYAEDATGDYAPVTYEVTVSNAAHYVAQIDETKYPTLDAAVAYANENAGSEIVLLEDITRDERITLTADATINLNGYTFGKTNGGWLIFVKEGATLTIDGTTANSAVYGGISLGAATNNNGSLVLNGGTYSCGENTACIHINGTCLNSNVTINGATITNAYDNAIQFNGKGTFTITDATITGATGIYIKSGEMTITNSTVTGTMAPANYSYYGNGANATGDGIVVDACNYPGGAPTVNIVSGTFSGTKSAIGNYNYQGTSEPAVGGITGGTFSTAVPAELCAPDYTPTSWTVGTETKYGVHLAGVIRGAAAQDAVTEVYSRDLDNGVVIFSSESDGRLKTSNHIATSSDVVTCGGDNDGYNCNQSKFVLQFPVNVKEFTLYGANSTEREISTVYVNAEASKEIKISNVGKQLDGTYTHTKDNKCQSFTAVFNNENIIAANHYVLVTMSGTANIYRVVYTEAECTTPVINSTNATSAKVGEKVTLTVNATAIGATYEWYRCDDAQGANPQLIGGATASKYEPTKAAGTEYFKVVVGCNCSEETAEAIIVAEEWVAVERTNVTGYTEWSWDGVYDGDGPTINESLKGLVLASYINAPNFDKLEGVNGGRVYRSNTYKAYQGTSLKFTTEVPGMLILDASYTDSGNEIAVNGYNLGALPKNHAANFKIAVASGDVTITSEGMRIWAMTFDPELSNYALSDNKLNGATRTPVTEGRLGTICLPKAGVMVGGSVFEVAYLDLNDAYKKIFFDEVISGEMVAGRPYIFLPNEGESELKIFYTGNTEEPAGNYHGLFGSYTEEELGTDGTNYILLNNQYCRVVNANTKVGANRGYFKIGVDGGVPTNAVAPAPGRRRISMSGEAPQVTTGVEGLNVGDQPVKVIIDGQLFILRGEKMYNANGQLVK